ncbi:MAG: UDP-N-acetylmuramoyl-L-alanyl-D-glutamate--2,6-diaminopimelate ligase [Armatimonadota bacterium]|nr:UDP-N-acetylmuramoyl-L-alanyl-D-glutamate--2,6-diaminopimelate ligase [bacterium]MCS7308867.1 UDP-N-acetylmuramoyl-L-alanyl-D-glutamate--2,6-diaminopimelate ligase [Armatimonadota bacterium]MDW8103397.1 UDP-N-acetylmuramoyl-L-alanyl-D-glutamate--2,6-diaminopimelate ligase [Armatimonadota bacterium]MDW8289751.1 UDP-N-acetylmuramoyl-L-alanyl-D-glutamate--2,6-diaminopimelate ligase [Armatimonadota bacterium]
MEGTSHIRLSELIQALPRYCWHGTHDPTEVWVSEVVYDSRQVQPGALFVAVPGQRYDGHDFVHDALSRGAVALVVERPVEASTVPVLQVPHAREALALLADRFYGSPSRSLLLVGVTGTNGKTTTTHLIAHLLREAGYRTGLIGTLGAKLDGVGEVPISHTTPEAPDIQRVLRTAVQHGVQAVAMEVSSHALHQHRTLGLEFDVAVFTNLTQDHLDYHGTMEAYAASKRRLFVDYPQRTRKQFQGVFNLDDETGRQWYEESAYTRWGYGVSSEEASVRALEVRVLPDGVQLRVATPAGEHELHVPLGGAFQVYNVLAALTTAFALSLPVEVSLAALETAPQVPGRFEMVPNRRGITVVVDYAHTPDGLQNVLSSARALQPRRLIVVFGCGGNRDRSKRPRMGEIAARMTDLCVVTSDNPRHESPEAIIEEILQGIPPQANVLVEPDRRRAIALAIERAEPGDMVVIAGKGHETVQIVGDQRIPFDDRQVAREILGEGSGGNGASSD